LFAQEFVGPQQQFGEIHQSGAIAVLFVHTVDALQLALERIVGFLEVAGSQALILLGIDVPLDLPRRPTRLVQLPGS